MVDDLPLDGAMMSRQHVGCALALMLLFGCSTEPNAGPAELIGHYSGETANGAAPTATYLDLVFETSTDSLRGSFEVEYSASTIGGSGSAAGHLRAQELTVVLRPSGACTGELRFVATVSESSDTLVGTLTAVSGNCYSDAEPIRLTRRPSAP